MGESDEGMPAALVRGVMFRDEPVPASALIRPRELDMSDERRFPGGPLRRHGGAKLALGLSLITDRRPSITRSPLTNH